MSAPLFITLEVTGSKAAQMGPKSVVTFGVKGGRLGRAADNDWVIDDPYVSRYQAHIGYANGGFYLLVDPDASAQMFLNTLGSQVLPSKQYPLTANDQILIDEYVIRIRLSGEAGRRAAAESLASRQSAPVTADASDPFAETAFPGMGPGAAIGGEPVKDILDVFGPAATARARPEPPRTVDAIQAPLGNHYAAPPARPSQPNIPDEDWYKHPADAVRQEPPPPAGDTFRAPPQSVRPTAKEPANHAGVSPDLIEFLRGAGVDADSVTPEVMASLGAILRVVVEGVVDILRARNQIRREFRMPVTLAEGQKNNPLKFSANAEDALHNILVKRNAAFLPAVAAFEEAFDDLRSHQMAMLKGLRMGYDSMLARFDPQKLEERFEPQGRPSAFNLPGRSKLWEHYRGWYAEQTEDGEDCFRRLFGEEFGKAYEQQMQLLARAGRKRRTGD